MQFSKTALDPREPTRTPEITSITPELIESQRESARQLELSKVESVYKPLSEKSGNYRIGANDVLSVTIWDHPELIAPNLTYTIGPSGAALPTVSGSSAPLAGFSVSADGYIQMPYAGQIKVLGLTENEAQQLVVKRLTPYIRNPQVTLRVGAFLSKRIYVGGEVKSPGVAAITNVPMNLPAAIGAAGGVLDTGDESRIFLSRNGKSYELDLPQMVADGVNPAKIILHDDDLVRVLPRENYKIMVTGEVLQPKPVLMRNNGKLSLSEALGEANSVRPDTAAPNAIYVIRATKDPAQPEVYQLNAKSPVAMSLAEDFQLKAKDVVYVDTTGLVRWNRVISLISPTANSVYLGERIGSY
ncbi:polysaccharide export outer membrane protein [Paraburkholderia eburnea]|uniref:Polysaccharide export outer membrane protein n=2 Tax=Paraburkholderia eburnea TaxID=1189126 RepID=A0A2S4LS67_9BURK|nr:polysaccharide export outer membrane protein [Paraburkholderia eburnea]PRZ12747.1 polysaccharide export outer membrane protein [Paraburkholderia eburnea]